MKTIFALSMACLFTHAASAAAPTQYHIQSSKCVGVLQADGSLIYRGDCPKGPATGTNEIDTDQTAARQPGGAIDTPEKAMELYNKFKNESGTAVSVEKDAD